MYKASKIELLRESISKITQILSDKDIQVTQIGTKAYVRRDRAGKVTGVNLPYVPDSASDELLAAIQGFVDHEVSHILFSDAKAAREAKMKGESIETLYEYFNDAHAEKSMRQAFKGSGKNLNQLAKFYTEKRLEKRWEELSEAGASDKEKLASLMGAVVRAWSGDPYYESFMRDKWDDLSSVLDKVPESFIKKVAKTNSSQDALNLTNEFLKYIETDDDDKDDGDSDDESEGENNQEGGDGAGSGGGKGDDDDQEEGEGQNSGGGGDDDDSEDDDDSDEGDGGSGGTQPDDSDGESDDEKTNNSSVGGSASFTESLRNEDNMDDVINEQVYKEMEDMNNSEYIPLTTQFDTFEKAKSLSQIRRTGDAQEAKIVKELHEECLLSLGAASKQFEKAFMAQNRTYYEPGKRSGRLNPSSLFKLKTGDDKVFRKKVDVRAKNTALTLVIDQSGSMSGAKIKYAGIAAYVLASILDRIKIPYNIVGFTTGNYPSSFWDERQDAIDEIREKYGRGFSRDDVINMYDYKGFDERFDFEQKSRLATIYRGKVDMGANVDGESIMTAAGMLAKRPEERKCMIVLSDGQPAAGGNFRHLKQHTKDVVKRIEQSGIDVVGLGICSDAVSMFYDNHIVFEDPEEIATRVLGELARMLLKSAS